MVDETRHEKPLFWIGRSYEDLLDCPEDVRRTFGFALGLAQQGGKFVAARPLKGFGGLECSKWSRTGRVTHSAVFTRSSSPGRSMCCTPSRRTGSKTPKQEIDLVKARLKAAGEHYKEWSAKQKKEKP